MYERIFPFHDEQQRGLCWLRLYQSPVGAVALLADVAGNAGPTLAEALPTAVRAVVDRYPLDPHSLTLVEQQAAPDEGNHPRFRHVVMNWEEVGGALLPVAPSWRWVERLAVETLVSATLSPFPFWQRGDEPRSLLCLVGGRQGALWRDPQWSIWHARLMAPEGQEVRADFEYTWQAQGWLLNRLAMLASEFDELPAWLLVD